MAKNLLGIDIGTGYLKLAVVDESNTVSKVACERMPENLVRNGRLVSPEAMGDFIKEALHKNEISVKNCAMALNSAQTYVRRVSLPMMNVQQLELNLPYEFKDYLGDDQAKYRFDYAVLQTITDDAGKPERLDLLAAACPAELINEYARMLKRAGLKLVSAAPAIMAFVKAVRLYQTAHPEALADGPIDYCFADFGASTTRVHLLPLGLYDLTRSMEFGSNSLVNAVAEHYGVAEAIALAYYEDDFEGAQGIPECTDLYERVGVELSRVVNFFNFNYQSSDLKRVLYLGSAAKYSPLMDTVRAQLPIDFVSAGSILQPSLRPEDQTLLDACFCAICTAAR